MYNEISELPQEIFETEVKTICRRYRIDSKNAREILEFTLAKHPDLVSKILERHPEEDVTRLGDYKKVIKEFRKQVYYYLRQYHKDKEREKQLKIQLEQLFSTSADAQQISALIAEMLSTHVSTQERFPHHKTFYETLFNLIEPPQTILDIGCGIFPLSYPFARTKLSPKTYIAIDKDSNVIETLMLFATQVKPTRLVPIHTDIATAKWKNFLEGEDGVELAFMLKLIPVIHRHSQELLLKLAEVPARQILITASTEAMTRKEDITRREDRVLRRFIEMTGKAIVAEFKIENEFGYLLG